MANFSGNAGQVLIAAAVVAEVVDWTLTEGVATIDNSALDDASDTHLVGSDNWNGSISCFWDDTDATGQGAMTVGASVVLSLHPEGSGVGDALYGGIATIETIETALARNAMVTASFTFKGNGALSKGTQP